MSRAARFDDEKRRLIESCFSKLDEDKVLIESYITHLRVEEDAHYPSSPPPPDSDPSQKKQRVIVIAVRNSGRVRMHKARENANGSYSIGKTWNLEELSAIQVYSHTPEIGTETEKEELQRKWAGGTGFTVTITKPYFWQAGTAKEKEFFIASAIKIYRKYTKGKVPELKGFSEEGEQMMLGNIPLRLASSPAPTQPQPPFVQREQSRDASRYRASPGPPASVSDQQRIPPMSPNRIPSEPPARFDGSPGPGPASRPFAAPEYTRASSPLKQQTPPPDPLPERSEQRPKLKGLSLGQESIEQLRPSPLSPPRRGTADAPRESPIPAPTSPVQDEPEEEFRPGLGPMIKKNAARDRFRKAAAAATAFKPRPGGAAEKILRAKEEREAGASSEPDGITSVVPRPQALQPSKVSDAEPAVSSPRSPTKHQEDATVRPLTPRTPTATTAATPQVEVTSPATPQAATRSGVELKDEPSPQPTGPIPYIDEWGNELAIQPHSAGSHTIGSPELTGGLEIPEVAVPPVRRRTEERRQWYRDIGVDPDLVEGKGFEIEDLLDHYDFFNPEMSLKEFDETWDRMHADAARLQRETIDALTPDPKELAELMEIIDECLAACDWLDNHLTMWQAALNTIKPDIEFLEKLNHGEQIRQANLKLLQEALTELLKRTNLPAELFETLRIADLSDGDSLEDVEACLIELYRSLILIDPSLIVKTATEEEDPYAKYDRLDGMRVVRERREEYFGENERFCDRFIQHFDSVVARSFAEHKTSMIGSDSIRLNREAFINARKFFWVYRPETAYIKMVNNLAWGRLLKTYQIRSQSLYSDTFSTLIAVQKKTARKPTGDEGELLFTHYEEEEAPSSSSSISLSAARKLTVKRSQTLAKSLRGATSSGERNSPLTPRPALIGSEKMRAEVFAIAMDEIVPIISQEQNFVVDFFHATSSAPTDFVEYLQANPLERRRATNLIARKPIEGDREMATRVSSFMNDIFNTSFTREMNSLLEWAISADPIQGVGILLTLSKHASFLHDDSQEYIMQTVTAMSTKVEGLWNKFIDDQVKAIDETKVKIKKRKGVISFMKTFPHFSAAVEHVYSSLVGVEDSPSIRSFIEGSYGKLLSAMFDVLDEIARSTPVQSEDQDEKEMLLRHVLIIENMSYFHQHTEDGHGGEMGVWRARALEARGEALRAYVASVVKRHFGVLLGVVERVAALQNLGVANTEIVGRATCSRSAVRAQLGQHSARAAREAVDSLVKRVKKHFGEGQEGGVALAGEVSKACEQGVMSLLEDLERVLRDVYPSVEGEKPVEMAISPAEMQALFKK